MTTKTRCSSRCNVARNTFCENSTKSYSITSTRKTKEGLTKQMENIYMYHNQIRQLFIDDPEHIWNPSLMKKIDDWEQESIMKIKKTANDIRQELANVFNKHKDEMNQTFTDLSQELNRVRVQNNLIETDIKFWLEKLEEFKNEFQAPKTINIIPDEKVISFITKIKLSQVSIDTFHRPIGDIRPIDDGFALIHGPSTGDATIHGKKEYYSGCHTFRFQIEKLGIPKWVFFGIISKDTDSQTNLYKTPTVFGWAGHHQVWLNGSHYHQYRGYTCALDENHIVELVIDCDKNVLRLTNENTSLKHEIDVPPVKCPYPWILYIGLYGSGDQVRLLFA